MSSVQDDLVSHDPPLFFGGHETFPFRYGWLKKGVDAVCRRNTFFSSDPAMISLGVGKNMVKSIKHWCLATNLIESATAVTGAPTRTNYVPSELGKALFAESGYDPFLEDLATLWLLHWQIASTPAFSTMWFWLFNHWHGIEFTKELVFAEIQKWLRRTNAKAVSDSQLKRDIDCCLRCYLHSSQSKDVVNEDSFDCPLSELGILVEIQDGRTYQFRRGEQSSLPAEILLYAVTEFCQRQKSAATSVALSRLLTDVGSPGKVFKLDEASLVRRLEDIETISEGVFAYGESANIKQIYRRRDVSSLHWLNRYYQQRTV